MKSRDQPVKSAAQDSEVAPGRKINNKVAPAGVAKTKRPMARKLTFKKIKQLVFIEEDDEDPEQYFQRSSLGAKIFVFFVAVCALTLGVGLTYYATLRSLTDFYVIGITSILVGIIAVISFILVIIRDIYYHRLFRRREKVIVKEDKLRTAEINEQIPSYFVPPTDVSRAAIELRRPSDAQLYGGMKARAKSAGLQSDGILTAAGISVREGESDSRCEGDFEGTPITNRSRDLLVLSTPPPPVTFPQHCREANSMDLENVVYKADMKFCIPQKINQKHSTEETKSDTNAIEEESTDL